MSADVSESLDDFFAKKDKKKKTKKSKISFTPDDFHPVTDKPKKKTKTSSKAGEVAEAAEAGDQAAESTETEAKKVEETDRSPPATTPPLVAKGDEDEWNDFAAEKEADYSGLRIQKLNIQKEEGEDDEEVEYDDDGKLIASEIQVWKVPEVPACPTPEPTTEVQSTVTVEKKDNSVVVVDAGVDGSPAVSSSAPQKYIPPAQRAAMKAAAASGNRGGGDSPVPRTVGGPRRNPKTAPDISNEELFPTLGGKVVAGKGASVWGGGSNSSSRGQSPFAGGGGGKLITDVSLENKWDALTRGAE